MYTVSGWNRPGVCTDGENPMKSDTTLSMADGVHGWSYLRKHSYPAKDGHTTPVPITDAALSGAGRLTRKAAVRMFRPACVASPEPAHPQQKQLTRRARRSARAGEPSAPITAKLSRTGITHVLTRSER